MNNDLIISYLTLRKLIGILGMALAFLCFFGGLVFAGIVKDSISAYYHSNMRDVMVSVLGVSGAFLLTYKGYDLLDNIMSSVAGASALLVGLFPCYSGSVPGPYSFIQISPKVSGVVHFTSAAVFFTVLALISYFLFTKSSSRPTGRKLNRNLIYRICGIVMLASLLVLAGFNLFAKELMNRFYLTLIFETVMLIAFGVSWLVKGEAILKDKEA